MNAFWMRATCLVIALQLAGPSAAATALPLPAVAFVPQKTSLLDLAATGKSLVAVGERGLIAHSDDGGRSWRGQLSPSTRTLTALAFSNDRIGVAVGHGGTVLRTEDGGLSWVAVNVKEIGRDAVLGVTALKNGQFLAYGAFGMYIVSTDQGKTWHREQVIADDFERHISKVIEASQAMFMVGETGFVARSQDSGKTWKTLTTPYAGSYFGILELNSGALLAYGMRGNVYKSKDQGNSWEKVTFDAKSTLNGGSVAADGSIVLTGNNGLIAVSTDNGETFKLRRAAEGTSIAKSLMLTNGELVYVGHMAAGQMAAGTKDIAP
jgi:photosystem II stability/assembly factor-like uncharacterized protein